MLPLETNSFEADAADILGLGSTGKEEEDEKSNDCFNGFVCF
jgi:hypothetical protein